MAENGVINMCDNFRRSAMKAHSKGGRKRAEETVHGWYRIVMEADKRRSEEEMLCRGVACGRLKESMMA